MSRSGKKEKGGGKKGGTKGGYFVAFIAMFFGGTVYAAAKKELTDYWPKKAMVTADLPQMLQEHGAKINKAKGCPAFRPVAVYRSSKSRGVDVSYIDENGRPVCGAVIIHTPTEAKTKDEVCGWGAVDDPNVTKFWNVWVKSEMDQEGPGEGAVQSDHLTTIGWPGSTTRVVMRRFLCEK